MRPRSGDVHLAVFRRIGLEEFVDHGYLAQGQLLRCEKLLKVIEKTHDLGFRVSVRLYIGVEPPTYI